MVRIVYSFDKDSREPGEERGHRADAATSRPTDKPNHRVSTLQRIVRGHKPGETVAFEVMHFGKKKTFNVKLTEAPDDAQLVASAGRSGNAEPTSATESRKFDKIGITVEPMSPELSEKVDPLARRGLVVSDVNVTGPAYRKVGADQTVLVEALDPGPRKALHTAADLDAVLSRMKSGDLITFSVSTSAERNAGDHDPGAVAERRTCNERKSPRGAPRGFFVGAPRRCTRATTVVT